MNLSPAEIRNRQSWRVLVDGPGLRSTLVQCHRETQEAAQEAADMLTGIAARSESGLTYRVEPPVGLPEPEPPRPAVADDDMIQVILHPVLRKPFERWLAERNAHLVEMPFVKDDLPTYAISITEPRLRPPTPEPVLPDTWTKVAWFWPIQDRVKVHAHLPGEFDALCWSSTNQRSRWTTEDGPDVSAEDLREEWMREQMCKDCTRRALAIEGRHG